jgi:ubiquinone/menaquinone biosynthesis C-methylase UbiE
MDASYRGNLRVWSTLSPATVQELPLSLLAGSAPGFANPAEFAERLYACESLNPTTGKPAKDEATEPYTLQWFLSIETQRHGRQGRWIPRLLEFAKHSGETLLGLGNGLGTDWLQYARHGASVIVCSPSADQLSLIRRNFELRGLSGRFLHADATALPLESASIDVACVTSLLSEMGDPQRVVEEIYRVLKPGGKVLVVAPAWFDIDFWFRCCFPWQRWLFARRRVPTTHSGFTRWGLRRLFRRFVEHRIHKRQLSRSEIPQIWRWIPRSLLERMMGRVLVLKAFKPLSTAMALQAAA